MPRKPSGKPRGNMTHVPRWYPPTNRIILSDEAAKAIHMHIQGKEQVTDLMNGLALEWAAWQGKDETMAIYIKPFNTADIMQCLIDVERAMHDTSITIPEGEQHTTYIVRLVCMTRGYVNPKTMLVDETAFTTVLNAWKQRTEQGEQKS